MLPTLRIQCPVCSSIIKLSNSVAVFWIICLRCKIPSWPLSVCLESEPCSCSSIGDGWPHSKQCQTVLLINDLYVLGKQMRWLFQSVSLWRKSPQKLNFQLLDSIFCLFVLYLPKFTACSIMLLNLYYSLKFRIWVFKRKKKKVLEKMLTSWNYFNKHVFL